MTKPSIPISSEGKANVLWNLGLYILLSSERTAVCRIFTFKMKKSETQETMLKSVSESLHITSGHPPRVPAITEADHQAGGGMSAGDRGVLGFIWAAAAVFGLMCDQVLSKVSWCEAQCPKNTSKTN